MSQFDSHQPTFSITESYRRYAVWLLCGVYLINIVDRQLLSILLEPLRIEFRLTDTSMGLLSGSAFALCYTALGIPLARLADRGHRVNIIVWSIVVWSTFTTATGFAKTFAHLLVARIGVAIGEAGCNPSAYSLIGDYFESKRRATALSIYQMGAYIGGFCGLSIGGYVAHQYGWRSAFYFVGVPGLAVALLVKLTLREPPRGFSDAMQDSIAPPSARVVLTKLFAKRSFQHLALATALHNLAVFSASSFLAAFLMRKHALTVAEVGWQLAIVTVVGGVLGAYFGGKLSDRFATRYRDARYYLWVPALSLLASFPFGEAVLVAKDSRMVMLLMIPSVLCSAAYLAPSITATYRLVGLRERALASALLLFILNLIGQGFGPLLSGYLSDSINLHLQANGVAHEVALADGLGWALQIMVCFNLWSAAHYVLAARTLRQEMVEG